MAASSGQIASATDMEKAEERAAMAAARPSTPRTERRALTRRPAELARGPPKRSLHLLTFLTLDADAPAGLASRRRRRRLDTLLVARLVVG